MKAFRYKLESLACRALAALIPRLPRRVCVRLGKTLGMLAYRLDRRGRAVALSNLEQALGDELAPEQREEVARTSFMNFARTMLDLFWAARLNERNYRHYMLLENFEPMLELHRQGRGIVLICVHQGNWEWTSLACGFAGLPVMVVTENFKNTQLSDVFNVARSLPPGHKIIPQENSMIRLLKNVRRGGVSGLLIDLNLKPTQPSVPIEGFGMKMCVTFMHAVLAQRAGAVLVPMVSEPLEDGRCRIRAGTPLEFSRETPEQEIAQKCWDLFEPEIRARPGQWLWPYKHWRYKSADAQRGYPFYANVSKAFDKLLRGGAKPPTRKNITPAE